MAIESVVSPVMMNRPIVDPKTGSLTQYGYALLSGLQIRTGGTVGDKVDIPAIEGQISESSFCPSEQPRPADQLSADVMQTQSFDVVTMPEPMQSAGCDPFAADMVWQRI